jgi:3-oxoacyl-[acyl-carrier-protein] synthase II
MGNLVSGCGSVELIASLMAANRGMIPTILNCDRPDPEIEADLVLGSPRPAHNPIFVKTNLTPLGQASALVIRGCPTGSNGQVSAA